MRHATEPDGELQRLLDERDQLQIEISLLAAAPKPDPDAAGQISWPDPVRDAA